jgi:methionyl-tRNA formyltransferase
VTEGPVRTVFLGSGGFGIPSLEVLAGHPSVAIAGVITAPPRPAGRRGEPRPTPIHDAALGLGLRPILTPDRLRRPGSIAEVLGLDPELAVLADYGQIVPDPLLDLPHGALNLHPSLLPRHRGATPIPASILAADTETGVTLMRMDAGLDTGPIIDQTRHALTGAETGPELERVLAGAAADLLRASLGPWLAGAMTPRPQADGEATLTRPLRRDDGRLDPGRGAVRLERQVRAYQPWPGSFVETDEGRLVVWNAAAVPATDDLATSTADAPVGTITPVGLVTADGLLAFAEVQPAGARRMPWEAYLRGRPAIVGRRVNIPAT